MIHAITLLLAMKNKLKLASLVLCFSVGHSSAALDFTIDTFTPNELTISIPVGPNTLDATGAIPNSKDLFLIDAASFNTDWILSDSHSFSGSGQIGTSTVDPGSAAIFNNNSSGGDIVRTTFDAPFSDGDTVASAVTATWSGASIFDPSKVDSLLLTWGATDLGSAYPWGDPQGVTATAAAVPEPSGLMLGLIWMGFAFKRRRR